MRMKITSRGSVGRQNTAPRGGSVADNTGIQVFLTLGRQQVSVESQVFAALFHNSVVSNRAPVRNALAGRSLPFATFLKLSREAEIPYPLFFAPLSVVEEQVRLKTDKLMSGLTKSSFSMSSRHHVELRDIELIVKDLLRKQELLRRYDQSLVKNDFVGLIGGSRRTVVEDARRVAEALELDLAPVRKPKSKEDALQVLIGQLESKQILVSQSTRLHMPQLLDGVKFSGITLKDKRVPFIFLASGDEGEGFEPPGRRVFTLMLLTVLIAQGIFAPVTYEGHSRDEESPRAYEIAAEILMPTAEMRTLAFNDLDSVLEIANGFKVTPSAVVMRARRLQQIDHETFSAFMGELEAKRPGSQGAPRRQPLALRALKKYNGIECSRRMLGLMDAGYINLTEFRRIVLLNKVRANQIADFRAEVG
jgi:hypothetical protein